MLNECWEFPGSRTPAGYGHVTIGGRQFYTHRLSYEALVGSIPEGLVIDHLCRNRACYNPRHLEPVTRGENARRGDCGKYQTRRKEAQRVLLGI